jgi:diguanylate cyclase (GGDEF)-like protein/PAS domain S-box-containing protein
MAIKDANTDDPESREQSPAGTDEEALEVEQDMDNIFCPEEIDVHNLKLLHELRVHQIELEQQNEELSYARFQAEEALNKYIDLYDHAPFSYFTLNNSGVIIKTNFAGAVLMSEDQSRLVGRPLSDFVALGYRSLFSEFLQETYRGDQERERKIELPIVDGNSKSHTVRILLRLMPSQEFHVAVIDITEIDIATKKLKIASDVFTCAHEGIVIVNDKGDIVDLNESCYRITGYEKEDMVGFRPWFYFAAKCFFDYKIIRKSLRRDGYWTGEIHGLKKNSEQVTLQLAISCSRDVEDKVSNYIGIFTDISDIYAQRKKIAHAAYYDPLTDLPNRTLLMQRMEHAIMQCNRTQQSLAVVYLDLDGFKDINDTYGHAVGDQLLCVLSKRMKATLRDGDTLARIGGDEFVLLLGPLEGEYGYIAFLERVRDIAASKNIVGNMSLEVSASIGVTVYPEDYSNAEQLIRHADQAMYEAKSSGKNRFHIFDATMASKSQILSEKISDIKDAIQNNEFIIFFQPKVNLRTGELVGVESLLRWERSIDNVLLPDDFLDVVENFSLATDIDFWVINSVLRQVSLWQSYGLDIAVSINIFPHEIQDMKFSERLKHLLERYPSVSPSKIQLEVIESKVIHNTDRAVQIMKSCCELGVTFALDDFGTGYSSLTYLQHLPADVIKIDKSFVTDMLRNSNDLKIVKGVIGLARAFDKEVIAEGVTCAALGDKLGTLGCDIVQGFGVAAPMEPKMLEDWLSTWNGKLDGCTASFEQRLSCPLSNNYSF